MFGAFQNFGRMGSVGGTSNLIAQLFQGGTKGFAAGLSVTEAFNRGWLFQDSAGTTAAAIEQPVGKVLDQSGGGNHATQPVSPKRPTLSARVNLLKKTEDYSDAAWTKNSTSVSGNLVSVTSTGNSRSVSQNFTATAEKFKALVRLRAGTSARASIGIYQGAGFVPATASIVSGAGALLANGGLINVTGLSGSADTYLLLTTTAAMPAGSAMLYFYPASDEYGGGQTAGDSVYLQYPDLRPADTPASLPAYQRVNTASDYDTTGFPYYWAEDGADDHLLCAAEGGGTTGFFLIAGIKLGAVGAAQTIFSDTGTNTGYRVRINASNKLELAAGNGSSYTTVQTTDTLALGQSAVITAWHDGTNLNVQVNGGTVVQAAFATASAGTTGFTMFQDNGASTSYFKGNVAAILYTKNSAPTAALRARLQASINRSMGGIY